MAQKMNCSWSISCLNVPEYQVYCPEDSFKNNIIVNIIVNFAFSFSSTILNGSVMWVIYFRERLQTPYYLILLSLAITDFTAGLIAQPLHVARITLLVAKHGYSSCALDISTVAIGYSLIAVSFFTVSYVTLERYLAIFYPFYHERRCTRQSSKKWLAVVWMIGLAYGAVGCLPYSRTRVIFVGMVSVIGTVFLIWNCFAYSRIFHISRKIQLRVRQEQQRFATDEKIVKEAKAARTTFVVVASLVAFYVPAFLTTAMRDKLPVFPKFINIWAYTFMLINSTANPVIYCYFCHDIGREMKKLWYSVRGKQLALGETSIQAQGN